MAFKKGNTILLEKDEDGGFGDIHNQVRRNRKDEKIKSDSSLPKAEIEIPKQELT